MCFNITTIDLECFLLLCLYLLKLYMLFRVWFKGVSSFQFFLSLIRGGQILFDSAAFYAS